MGHSLESIPFFSDAITLRPHTATAAKYIGRKVSIAQFTKGKPCSLSRRDDNGEYVVETTNGEFMEGPEV